MLTDMFEYNLEMNRQLRVVLIVALLMLGQATAFFLTQLPDNGRILSAKSKKKSSKRKLYHEDYQTALKPNSHYLGESMSSKLNRFLTMAMAGMVFVNGIKDKQPVKKDRKLAKFNEAAAKVSKKMTGSPIMSFLGNQNKKMKAFLAKRSRKLQMGGGLSSIMKIGEQFLAQEYGIPPGVLSMISPMAGNLLGSLGGSGSTEKDEKPSKKAKSRKQKEKKKNHKKAHKKSRKSDDDDDRI